MDAYITDIQFVKPWPQTYRDGTPLPEEMLSDNLELAYIKNWQCVIQKGTFKQGDKVLYIQPDASIPEEDTPWADGIRRYLGKQGRVKIVKLRGQISNGIIIAYDDIKDYLKSDETACFDLKIGHYEAPVSQNLEAKCASLPQGIEKSDEENYQSLNVADLRLGEYACVTRKIDGSSALIYYNPEDDDLRICSRSLTLKLECKNNYTIALEPYYESVKALGKFVNMPIAVRGEVYGNGVNRNKANKDALKPLGFMVYGVRLPMATSPEVQGGCYDTDWHFSKLNDRLADAEAAGFGSNLKRFSYVPIVCEQELVTEEMLKKYEEAPADDGEGVVFNFRYDPFKPTSYKDKSADYYSKMK